MLISSPIFWHDSFIDLAYWSITQTLSTWSNFPLAYRDNCGLHWRKGYFPLHHYSTDFYPSYTVHAFSHGWVKPIAIDGNFCCSYIYLYRQHQVLCNRLQDPPFINDQKLNKSNPNWDQASCSYFVMFFFIIISPLQFFTRYALSFIIETYNLTLCSNWSSYRVISWPVILNDSIKPCFLSLLSKCLYFQVIMFTFSF